jgi:hypothetical protein
MKTSTLVALLGASLLVPRLALADDPKYEYREAPPPPKPAEKPTVWKANMQLGLTWVEGNAETVGFSGSALAGVKHWNNSFELFGQGAFAEAGTQSLKGGPIDGSKVAAESWLWRARYDRFFLDNNTAFVAFQMNGDKLAGIVYRVEPQVGYARLFFKSVHQLFRGEIGYDYSYEHYVIGTDPRNADFHSARLMLFYENKFTPYAAFSEGVEFLWALNKLEHVRINSLTSLSSTISKNVSLKLNFTIKANFDPPLRPVPPNIPGSQFDVVDTVLEAVLAVTFL